MTTKGELIQQVEMWRGAFYRADELSLKLVGDVEKWKNLYEQADVRVAELEAQLLEAVNALKQLLTAIRDGRS